MNQLTGIISPAGKTASGIQEAAQLRAQVSAHQVQLAALLQNETEQNPDVHRVRRELGSLQAQIVQMEKSQTGGLVGAPSNLQVPALELEYVRKLREVKYHETLFDIVWMRRRTRPCMLPGALGRADALHVFYSGLPLLILSCVAIPGLAPRWRRVWLGRWYCLQCRYR